MGLEWELLKIKISGPNRNGFLKIENKEFLNDRYRVWWYELLGVIPKILAGEADNGAQRVKAMWHMTPGSHTRVPVEVPAILLCLCTNILLMHLGSQWNTAQELEALPSTVGDQDVISVAASSLAQPGLANGHHLGRGTADVRSFTLLYLLLYLSNKT